MTAIDESGSVLWRPTCAPRWNALPLFSRKSPNYVLGKHERSVSLDYPSSMSSYFASRLNVSQVQDSNTAFSRTRTWSGSELGIVPHLSHGIANQAFGGQFQRREEGGVLPSEQNPYLDWTLFEVEFVKPPMSSQHRPATAKVSNADISSTIGLPYDHSSTSGHVQTRQVGGRTTWRCTISGCGSRSIFTRPCDLRKHQRRHAQRLYCRRQGCPRSKPAAIVAEAPSLPDRSRPSSASSSLSSATDTRHSERRSHSTRLWFSCERDRVRHEAKHSPKIRCSWQEGICGRVFSRLDNMRDHVRRVHGAR